LYNDFINNFHEGVTGSKNAAATSPTLKEISGVALISETYVCFKAYTSLFFYY